MSIRKLAEEAQQRSFNDMYQCGNSMCPTDQDIDTAILSARVDELQAVVDIVHRAVKVGGLSLVDLGRRLHTIETVTHPNFDASSVPMPKRVYTGPPPPVVIFTEYKDLGPKPVETIVPKRKRPIMYQLRGQSTFTTCAFTDTYDLVSGLSDKPSVFRRTKGRKLTREDFDYIAVVVEFGM